MKKFGFTLAEVLITLSIIGVISALVLPTFTASTQRAKVGPKLAKAVSVFEQATKAILDDAQADAISDADFGCASGTALTACFYSKLENHLKGKGEATSFTSSDGIQYSGSFNSNIGRNDMPHKIAAMDDLTININPNTTSTPGGNIFHFRIMDDGSLIPWGSSNGPAGDIWTTKCKRNATVTGDARNFCAGHVMENNLKVEYRLGRNNT